MAGLPGVVVEMFEKLSKSGILLINEALKCRKVNFSHS